MSVSAYSNPLKALKIYYRDFLGIPEIVETFRFPRREIKYRWVPTKRELQQFYEALNTERSRALFLFYATTGLRKREVLRLTFRDIDFERRMIVPNKNRGRTKHTWITFYNEEAEEDLMKYLKTRRDGRPKVFPINDANFCRIWREARQKTGIHITPQALRRWFCSEMARLGVPDRYVDAFCGRVPRTVLAMYYTDYRPETLKEIYDRAGLRVLS